MDDLYVSDREVSNQMLRIQKALRAFESDAYNLSQLIERIHKSKAVQSSAVASRLEEKVTMVTNAIKALDDSFANLEPTITEYLLDLDKIDDLLE